MNDPSPERAAEIALNVREVQARIRAAAERAGRDPAGVTLIAVSKTMPASDLRAAYAAGLRDFGENYAQEFARKLDELADLPDLRWHFIGALQSNKAKVVVPAAHLVHAVDRPSVVEALSRRAQAAGVTMDVLVEVNVAGEASKAGIAPGEVPALLGVIEALPAVRVRGLMCIPPFADEPEASRPALRRLREVRDALRAEHPSLELLSMGMSGDFEIAIEEGATHVRVGTALFGARGKS